MRLVPIILTILALVCSCKKDSPTPDFEGVCNTKNPTEDIPWLKSQIATMNGPSAYADYFAKRAIYKGREILWIDICCPTCDMLPPTAKYCDGSTAGQFGTDIQYDNLSGIVDLWRSHNGVCPN